MSSGTASVGVIAPHHARALFTALVMVIASPGCSQTAGSPTLPTPAPVSVSSVIVSGNRRLTSLGQTTQLSAQATMSDGSKRDITTSANWQSGNTNVAAVSQTGLVTGVGFGFTGVGVRILSGYSEGVTILVLPEGTYVLSGRVWDPMTNGLADVRIEIIGGPMSGNVTTTDTHGQYQYVGVGGVVQVRASKDGYLTAIQSVPQDTGSGFVQANGLELSPNIPYASVGGLYQLTFKASNSCQLPEDVATRMYTAGINQSSPGSHVLVVLQSGEFFNNLNQFRGLVEGNGNAVSLDLFSSGDTDSVNPLDYGIVEQLPGNRLLQLDGTAQGTATATGISTTLNGTARFFPSGATSTAVICKASDHQLLFARATATPSRQKTFEGIR
jgi:hypothetical protein